MAASGFTPISLYYSTTASAVPTSGNLANGELGLNIADMKLYAKNSAGTVTLLASSAAATPTTPGGSNTQVQFNSSGTFAGSSNMTFNGTTLTVADLTDSSLTVGRVVYAGTAGNLTGSANLFWDIANNRLGVGTASPVGRFQVAGGTATFSGGGSGGVFGDDNTSYFLLQGSSTASSAAIYLNGAGRTSFGGHLQYAGAQHTWYNAAVNTTWMVIDGSGRLLVGHASTQGNNSRLQLSGGFESFGSQGGNGVLTTQSFFNTNSSGFAIAQMDVLTGANIYEGVFRWQTKDVGGTMAERLRVASAGQIGLSGANYGTAGQVLTSGGSGAAPTWATAGGGTTMLFCAFSSTMGL
jgi:hypothetical protein